MQFVFFVWEAAHRQNPFASPFCCIKLLPRGFQRHKWARHLISADLSRNQGTCHCLWGLKISPRVLARWKLLLFIWKKMNKQCVLFGGDGLVLSELLACTLNEIKPEVLGGFARAALQSCVCLHCSKTPWLSAGCLVLPPFKYGLHTGLCRWGWLELGCPCALRPLAVPSDHSLNLRAFPVCLLEHCVISQWNWNRFV